MFLANAPFVRVRKARDDIPRRNEHAGRAVAALQRVLGGEGGAQLGHYRVVGVAFDSAHFGAVAADREGDARARRHAVDLERARAADAVLAAEVGARQPLLFSQKVGQVSTRLDLLLNLLPALDDLELALNSVNKELAGYTWVDGIRLIHRKLAAALESQGLAPIETVGQRFDPKVHEAVATIPSGSVEPGFVVREVRRGWRLGDELLRPSQVVVAAPREAAGSWR